MGVYRRGYRWKGEIKHTVWWPEILHGGCCGLLFRWYWEICYSSSIISPIHWSSVGFWEPRLWLLWGRPIRWWFFWLRSSWAYVWEAGLFFRFSTEPGIMKLWNVVFLSLWYWSGWLRYCWILRFLSGSILFCGYCRSRLKYISLCGIICGLFLGESDLPFSITIMLPYSGLSGILSCPWSFWL